MVKKGNYVGHKEEGGYYGKKIFYKIKLFFNYYIYLY